MIVVAIQLWAVYIDKTKEKSKKLEIANKQLEMANNMIIESNDHIKTLYQSINILTSKGNKEGLIKLLFKYTRKITKSHLLFYYDVSEDENKMFSQLDNGFVKSIEEYIQKDLKNILEQKSPVEISISNTRFIMMPVKSNYKDYGILGCKLIHIKEGIIYRNTIYQLQFLSELLSTTFERLSLEEINERLLISEEQNRIANEIHDSVLQRLFSMSCGVFSLIRNLDKYTKEEIEDKLNIIRNTTKTVMKELREKIYGLSWKKAGSDSFVMDIKNYIEDMKRFNGVTIPFNIEGDDELLNCEQKKAFYRIICEGIANAVRHGKAQNIEVSLTIEARVNMLRIIDDGVGFDVSKVTEDKTGGLGFKNLYQLTQSLGGEIKIDSYPGRGTKIQVVIPNKVPVKEGEALV